MCNIHIKARYFYKMTSATLQNNCRLRIVLILIISILIRVARGISSHPVHKATNLLEINYILYGIVLLLSLLPYKTSWILATIVNGAAAVIGSLATVLAILSTFRCVSANQIGCIQTLPGSIVVLGAAALIVVLDIYQTWNLYLISRFPTFKTLPSQRIRIIFSWALPFAWLLNIKAIIDDKWSWVIVTHLLVDPLIIVMANTDEKLFLGAIHIITIVLDVFALMIFGEARIIMIQIALTAVGFIMTLSIPTSRVRSSKENVGHSKRRSETTDTTIRRRAKNNESQDVMLNF